MAPRLVIVALCLFACALQSHAQSDCRGPEALEQATRDRSSSRNWAALAGWFGEHRQFDCASSAFHSALNIDPNSASLHYFAGLTLNSSGKPREALDELQRSIELDPKQLQPRLLAGVVLNELDRRGDAEEAWEGALAIDPNSVIALDWLAKARISDRQFQSAIDLLTTAPHDKELTLDLALAYSQDGRFEQAASTLNSALTRTRGDLRLSEALATVYSQAHRYQDASKVLRAALTLHPHDHDVELLYLQVLVLQDDFVIARPLVQQLLAAHPDNFDALYLSGLLEMNQQQYAAAISQTTTTFAISSVWRSSTRNKITLHASNSKRPWL
jgi:protein O-GlcNAc transferase